jgi:hypothetical protein
MDPVVAFIDPVVDPMVSFIGREVVAMSQKVLFTHRQAL